MIPVFRAQPAVQVDSDEEWVVDDHEAFLLTRVLPNSQPPFPPSWVHHHSGEYGHVAHHPEFPCRLCRRTLLGLQAVRA